MKTTAANNRTTVILVVIILDLFFLVGLIITGSVLLTYDVSITTQLIDQYNGIVKGWTDISRPAFSGFTMQGQVGNNAKQTLTARQIIDPIPAEKGISSYQPLQYQSDVVDILTGNIEWKTTATLTYYLSWTKGETGQVQVDVPLFAEKVERMDTSSPQRQCDDAGGHYNPQTFQCTTYWVLNGICVLFDPRTKKLARVGNDFGCTPGLASSPFPNQWRVGQYQKVERASREIGSGPKDRFPKSQGRFMTREIHDPFVKFNELTQGKLDFKAVRDQPYFILGIVFLSMSSVPLFFLFILGCYGLNAIVQILIAPKAVEESNEARKGLLNEEPEGRTGNQFPLEYGN